MRVLVSDDFNRASIGANWTTGPAASAWSISGNTAVPTGAAYSNMIYTGLKFEKQQYAQGKVTSTGTTGGQTGAGLGLRGLTTADTQYFLSLDHAAAANMCIVRSLAGALTTLLSVTRAFANGDGFRFECLEERSGVCLVRFFHLGVEAGVVRDSTALTETGAPALVASGSATGVVIDDFEAGDLTPIALQAGWPATSRARRAA